MFKQIDCNEIQNRLDSLCLFYLDQAISDEDLGFYRSALSFIHQAEAVVSSANWLGIFENDEFDNIMNCTLSTLERLAVLDNARAKEKRNRKI